MKQKALSVHSLRAETTHVFVYLLGRYLPKQGHRYRVGQAVAMRLSAALDVVEHPSVTAADVVEARKLRTASAFGTIVWDHAGERGGRRIFLGPLPPAKVSAATFPCDLRSHRPESNWRPTVYETLGALNAFKRLGGLLTNRVRSSGSHS
jgi:hypothetical protein